MNYKCRFCGYRFKDKDEQICPECLTAREDDISCGIYGEDEHSHQQYDDSYFSDNRFIRSDTFKDGKADFLKEERREENRVEAAKYERKNGGDINVEATPAPRAFSNSQKYNYGNQYSAVNKTNAPKKQASGKGCGVFIILIIILGMFSDKIPGLIDKVKEQIESSENSSTTRSSTQENEEPEDQGVEGAIYGDCDFSVYMTECSIGKTSTDDLDSFQKQNLYYQQNDDLLPVSNSDHHNLYFTKSTFNFEYPDHQKVEKEDIEIIGVYCYGYDSNDELISEYTGFLNDTSIISINRTVLSPTLMCDAESEYAWIFIDLKYKGEEVSISFNIDLDEQ